MSSCIQCGSNNDYTTTWNADSCIPCPTNTEAFFFAPFNGCQCVPGTQPSVNISTPEPQPCEACPTGTYFTDLQYHNDASQPVSTANPGCISCYGPPQQDPTTCYTWHSIILIGSVTYDNLDLNQSGTCQPAASSAGIDGVTIVLSDGNNTWKTISQRGVWAFTSSIVISVPTTFTLSVDLASRPDLRLSGLPVSLLGTPLSSLVIANITVQPNDYLTGFDFCLAGQSSCRIILFAALHASCNCVGMNKASPQSNPYPGFSLSLNINRLFSFVVIVGNWAFLRFSCRSLHRPLLLECKCIWSLQPMRCQLGL